MSDVPFPDSPPTAPDIPVPDLPGEDFPAPSDMPNALPGRPDPFTGGAAA